MSQVTVEVTTTVEVTNDHKPVEAGTRAGDPPAFSYKPVPVLAPVAAFFGIVSVAALVSELAVLLTLVGMVMGGLAVRKISRSRGEFGGLMWARIGLFGSVIFFFAGVTTHVYAYATEVPEGYQRVNFPRDIAAKQFVVVNGARQLHPEVKPLKDQKIFIKGFMYNTQKQTGLTGFTLLKDNGQCCFGGNPKPYDMMIVRMPPGKTVDKIDGLVSVAGTLRCDPGRSGAVYMIEATYVDRARTSH